MKKNNLLAALIVLIAIAATAGCSDDGSLRPNFGHINVKLTDAPGDFDEVNIVFNGISIRLEEGEHWEDLSDETLTLDLMTLQNGVVTTLSSDDVPAGHYTEIRLPIGTGSTVVVDGTTYPLEIPSGASSGLKLKGDIEVPEGGTVDVVLDFDAARSIHQTGNGKYILRPVIRMVANPTVSTGQIRGHLLPETASASVFAIQGDDTLQTTFPGSDGRFTLSTLLPGTYDVRVDVVSGHRDTTLAGVGVTAGQTTDLGDIQLQPE